MKSNWQEELEKAIWSNQSLDEIVACLRRYQDMGISKTEVHSFLEELHEKAPDEERDDRIREVADFVVGFCSPHMKIWNE
jgi:hypothetical protein